jgi:hypothetical protein
MQQVAEQRDPLSGAPVQAKKSSRQSSGVRGPLTLHARDAAVDQVAQERH